MNRQVSIRDKMIGEGYPTYVIAEMSANHGHDINKAIEIIHAAKDSGANCIKIQTYKPDTITINCDNEYFSIKEGLWKGANLYNLYENAYTPLEWQARLKEEASKIGLDFFSTPFDKTAVDFLEKLEVDFYKIASFEIVDIPLIEYIAMKGKPIIMSTGMATLEEIEEAVETVRATGNENLCLLKCSSAYPAIPADMNLETMKDYYNRFNVPIGLSDHSRGFLAAIIAVAMGANIIEKHICIDRKDNTPDSPFSMEPHEFKEMVYQIRQTEMVRGKVCYQTSEKERMSKRFRKSIFVVKDIRKDEILTENNIRIIRPADGLKPKYFNSVIGKKVNMDIQRGTPLKWDMINDDNDK